MDVLGFGKNTKFIVNFSRKFIILVKIFANLNWQFGTIYFLITYLLLFD